jgi:ribonuclease BN (tRNA processing enzyme)
LSKVRKFLKQFTATMSAVTFLGTGPGTGIAGRFQSSILLKIDQKMLLLDAGEPCSSQLLELGVPLSEIDAVWISHAHADHIGGLPMLLQASWLHGRRRPLPVAVPRDLAVPLRAWLDAILLPDEVLRFSAEIFSWQAETASALEGVTVIPHLTTHLGASRQQVGNRPAESFMFEILGAGKRLVYSGDLGSADDLNVVVGKPLDLLVCELAHFAPDDLIAVLRNARIQTLCLTHVASELDARRDELQVLFERELANTAVVYLPDDGENLDL